MRDRKSIRDLPPLEKGGENARKGFDFQDHVAAGWLIRMLSEEALVEVWCETHDDLTLVWDRDDAEEFEFVQVKAVNLDHLWSVAELTKGKKKKGKKENNDRIAGSSILEKSLANDRGEEKASFRLVTTLPPSNELSFLAKPLGSPDRSEAQNNCESLIEDLETRIDDFRSENGNGVSYWLKNTIWETNQDSQSLADSNKQALFRASTALGEYLFPDQLDEIYQKLLALAQIASLAPWGEDPERKKFTKPSVEIWLRSRIVNLTATNVNAGKKLNDKLVAAGIPSEDIAVSAKARLQYLKERYNPKYLSMEKLAETDSEVEATLHRMRAQLDAGIFEDNGIEFHARCLSALDALRESMASPPTLSVLHGCMYAITDRCSHRFRRATS